VRNDKRVSDNLPPDFLSPTMSELNPSTPPSSPILSQHVQKRVWLTWLACAACVIVFIGIHSDSTGSKDPVQNWGWQPSGTIYDGAYWVLFSSVFVHVEFWHLAFNLYWLYHLGRWLEQSIGSARWLAFVAGSAFVSSTAELAISGQAGIGGSGVGYALFGFGWVLRKHVPAVAGILTQGTVFVFFAWLIGCVILTSASVLNVANAAHFAGFLFGTALGGWLLDKSRRPLISCALAFLMVAGFVTLIWAPWSMQWTSWRGVKAHKKGDFSDAIRWYERSMKLGQDEKWCQDAIDMARSAIMVQRLGQSRTNSPTGRTAGDF